MDCAEFLDSYSDYLDRRLEIHPVSEYGQHIENCPSCREYDRVMQRGLHVFRRLQPPDSTPDFANNLRSRVAEFQHGVEQRQNLTARAATLATLSTTALLVLVTIPMLRASADTVRLPPVVVEAPNDASSSLWGPAPVFANPPALLLVPNFPSDPVRLLPSERPSLFRDRGRATQAARISALPNEAEKRTTE